MLRQNSVKRPGKAPCLAFHHKIIFLLNINQDVHTFDKASDFKSWCADIQFRKILSPIRELDIKSMQQDGHKSKDHFSTSTLPGQ